MSDNGQAVLPVVAYADAGGPLLVREIDQRLSKAGIHEEDGDAATADAPITSPPSSWKCAEDTCSYVAAMIGGWATDEPSARHPWLVSGHVRLNCAHRRGCLSADALTSGRKRLNDRVADLCAGREPRRRVGNLEIAGAMAYGMQRAATMSDDEVDRELGHHLHERITGESAATGKDDRCGVVLTDKGNALALVAAHAGHLRYVPEMGKWIEWTGIRWHIDADTGAIDTAAGQIAMNLQPQDDDKAAIAHKKRSLSRAGITDMVRLARSDPAMRIAQEKLDASGYELNTPGGIVNLRTGELGEHRPDAWHTKVTGVAYDPDADCPLWKAFLCTMFGNNQELIDYLQKLAGNAAIGVVFHHILPFCFGAGQNGKTVLLEVISRVLGGYAITAPVNFLLAGQNKHETEIARLAGARFVVCSEINQGTKFDEAKVKLLTGGDKLTGRFMHRDFFDFRPSHTLFLMGNHQPAVGAGGDSFWRRVRLIPFEHRVPDEKCIENLDAQLVEREGPAILAWIVRGAVAVATGRLIEPDVVMAATEDYAESEDHISQFIGECATRVDNEFRLPSGQVYRRYVDWCQENGMRPKANSVFGRDMSTHGFGTIKSNGRRFVRGIMLDTPAADDPRNRE